MTSSESSYDYSGADESETGKAPPGQPPWRRPIISLTIGLFAAILLGLAIYVFADKSGGQSGTTQTPTSATAPTNAPAAPTP